MVIVMTNAPRKVDTIFRTITYLRRAGFTEEIIVFSEPGSPVVEMDDVYQYFNEKRLGCFKNFEQCLKYGINNAQDIFILQDDARYNRHTAEKIYSILPDDYGYVTPYLSTHDAREFGRKEIGFHEHTKGWYDCFWGCTISLLIKKEVAENLIGHKDWKNYKRENKVDCIVGHCITELGYKQFYHYPSLVDHMGVHSTLGHVSIADNKGYRYKES